VFVSCVFLSNNRLIKKSKMNRTAKLAVQTKQQGQKHSSITLYSSPGQGGIKEGKRFRTDTGRLNVPVQPTRLMVQGTTSKPLPMDVFEVKELKEMKEKIDNSTIVIDQC
jgi:hypothetical protein